MRLKGAVCLEQLSGLISVKVDMTHFMPAALCAWIYMRCAKHALKTFKSGTINCLTCDQ